MQRSYYTDSIDALDHTSQTGHHYHHAGPYEAALPIRNRHPPSSPLAAVHDSNMEALRATPRENILDSLRSHKPLQGVASIPPGGRDGLGNTMLYQEGSDLMRDSDAAGGPYKRWPGIDYHPADLKGKGEPAYSAHRSKHRSMPVSAVYASAPVSPPSIPRTTEEDGERRTHRHRHHRSLSRQRLTDGFARHFGSVRRHQSKKKPAEEAE
ncbi:hypothetical protein CP533_4351 [Ophiocordyceps camponoti-saundersi (nom. inval.)]|nr:hypothetical protein CP533_4351 [Ophiocordyceps camponoti-saundersi (nom. inval.)]